MINLLIHSGIVDYILPEIIKLEKIQQSPKWHPEGNVLEHTIRVMENLVGESLELQLAGLFHDFGKIESTIINENGEISSPDHAYTGADITRDILIKFKFPNKVIDYVSELVYSHMKINFVLEMKKSKQKKFFSQENYNDLRRLNIADKMGARGDISHIQEIDLIKSKLELELLKPVPFITGKDLIDIGYTSSRLLGDVKNIIYDRQLEGLILNKENAIELAKNMLTYGGK